MPLPQTLGRRLLFGVLFGVAVYAAILIWADLGAVMTTLRRLPLWVIPTCCALSLANYAVRFWKWRRYCELLGIRLAPRASVLIYLSGLSMSVTPGKMGEVFKSWLVRKVTGVRIHESAPIVIAERFTDLLGYLILVAIGGLSMERDADWEHWYDWVCWAVLAACGLALVLVGSERFAAQSVAAIRRTPVVSRLAPRVEVAFKSTRILLAPREVLMPTLVSVVGWGLECTGFWIIANAVVPGSTDFDFALFAFAFSAVAGAVAIVAPGGLLITEGLLGTLLRPKFQHTLNLGGEAALEIARAHAAGAVILARLCTLWFAVLVGFVATALFTRRFGEVDDAPDDPAG